jgi:hypothetical protein
MASPGWVGVQECPIRQANPESYKEAILLLRAKCASHEMIHRHVLAERLRAVSPLYAKTALAYEVKLLNPAFDFDVPRPGLTP